MKLWFLLVDGKKFLPKGVPHNYSVFYADRMQTLKTMAIELPGIYKSLRKHIDDNVFGKREEEVMNLSERQQVKYMVKFRADVEVEKARQKERREPGDGVDFSPAVDDVPCLPTGGPVVAVAPNSQLTEPLHPRVIAGCVWDGDNWSCAYDAVFMAFWSIYKKSPPGWRDKWILQAPEWNRPLKTAFDSLLMMAQDERTSQATMYREFNSYRETFRNALSRVNLTYFRRLGKVTITVARVLTHIFGSPVQESQPYLDQLVTCDTCRTPAHCNCSFSLLGSLELLGRYLTEGDTGPRLSLQEAINRYIHINSQIPHIARCTSCSGPVRVESLSIPEMAWFWIELCNSISPISPSPQLVFDLQGQRQVYTLQAIIYHGANHFTARLSDELETWWKYDGVWDTRAGVLRVDRVEHEVDLLELDGRRAGFLLYCQADLQG